MEKHKNLSIFIPHEGCPNQCSFCDQKKISGSEKPPTAQDVSDLCQKFLPKEGDKDGQNFEIAFFGGSFTAIKKEYMLSLLRAAQPFLKAGRAGGIRVSTRPDAIDENILQTLKEFGVSAIELGAQSMQEDVLSKNLRGHSVKDVYISAKLIKSWGFSLGLQMMTGLYAQENYFESAMDTAKQFIEIRPQTVRIYPTITLKDTLLHLLYTQGVYTPPSLQESVDICAKLLPLFENEGIKIIKLGLHADKSLEKAYVAGPYHPAFKELVQGQVFLDKFKKTLSNFPKGGCVIHISPKNISQAVGQGKCNIKALKNMGYDAVIKSDDTILNNEYKILSGGTKCI